VLKEGGNLAYNINNGFKLKLIDLSDNTSVASSGGTNKQTLQPDPGKIYEVCKIWYVASDPAGSSAGSHKIECHYETTGDTYNGVFRIAGNTGSGIYTRFGGFVGDSEEAPSTEATQQLYIGSCNLVCSNTYPLNFTYTNSTDVNQTATRTLKILVKEYNEMS